MLAKLIAWGETRDAARRRALAALRSYPILGIRTNTGLLIELLEHPRFIEGALDTGFLDAEGDAIRARLRDEASPAVSAVVAAARATGRAGPLTGRDRVFNRPPSDPWTSLRGARVYRGGRTVDPGLDVVPLGNGRYLVRDGVSARTAYAVATSRETWVFLDGRVHLVASSGRVGTRSASTDDADALAAPMPATVVKIEVSVGQHVTRDSLLIMLEAMKMELPIKAPRDGRVTAIHCRAGEIVQPGVPLLELS